MSQDKPLSERERMREALEKCVEWNRLHGNWSQQVEDIVRAALAEPAQEFEPVCEDCDTESRCHGAGNCPGKPSQPQAICGQPDRNARVLEICTDNSFIYYGPYKCEGCGRMICKLAREQGGDAFDYPEGPIYPNTNWVLHVCPQPQGKE